MPYHSGFHKPWPEPRSMCNSKGSHTRFLSKGFDPFDLCFEKIPLTALEKNGLEGHLKRKWGNYKTVAD